MFSGIVEAQGVVLAAWQERDLVRIDVQKPSEFNDLSIGDSVCTNGVCLTIEAFDAAKMTFALGAETLRITGWTVESLQSRTLNLERSLRINDRNHGHMVSGHVDDTGCVESVRELGGSIELVIRVPVSLQRYFWKKGSWAVSGVSLTINSVDGQLVSSCLIPETLKRTNLGALGAGDVVNLEVDTMARGLMNFLENFFESSVGREQLMALAQGIPSADRPTSNRRDA
jgi:riboflavin synthase